MARSKQTQRKIKGGKPPRTAYKVEHREVFLYRIQKTPITENADLEKYQKAAAAEYAARQKNAAMKYEATLERHKLEYENYLKELERQWIIFKAGEVEGEVEEQSGEEDDMVEIVER